MTSEDVIRHTWDNNTIVWDFSKLPVLLVPVRLSQSYYPIKTEEPPRFKPLDVVKFVYETEAIRPLARVHRIVGYYKEASLIVEENFVRIT